MVGALLFVTDLLFDAVAVVVATTALAAPGCVFSWCLAPLRRRARVPGDDRRRERIRRAAERGRAGAAAVMASE